MPEVASQPDVASAIGEIGNPQQPQSQPAASGEGASIENEVCRDKI